MCRVYSVDVPKYTVLISLHDHEYVPKSSRVLSVQSMYAQKKSVHIPKIGIYPKISVYTKQIEAHEFV